MHTTYQVAPGRIKVVTSFGYGGWDLYAKKFVETFVEKWPENVRLEVWYHDCEKPAFENPRVRFKSLHDSDAHETFVKMATPLSNKDDYRYDIVKFGHKVYAITESDTSYEDYDWLVWMDADIECVREITKEDLSEWLSIKADEEDDEEYVLPDVVHLDRKAMTYSETSFMAFNMDSEMAYSLLMDLRYEYDTGELMLFREWHDGFIFERLLRLHKRHGMIAKSLTSNEYMGLEAFMHSPLGDKMIHYKGPVAKQEKKFPAAATPVGPQRYKQLEDLVEYYECGKVAETGTWGGDRAIAMANAAFKVRDDFHYLGYDLFEEATNDTDSSEFNTKRHFSKGEVEAKLEAFKEASRRRGKTFVFELFGGDTKSTIARTTEKLGDVDLAYLDGGHSDITVENDWFHFQHVPVLVFDDYFMPDEEGKMPAPEHCGTNNILRKHDIGFTALPSLDRVLGGGITHLVVVTKEGVDPPRVKQNVRVNPKDCVDKEEIHKNMDENRELIGEWLRFCSQNKEECVIVSGGPSVKKDVDKIRELYNNGAYIFCVKHSLNVLMDAGITPYGCVILDPRDVDGVSTHGFNRRELLRFPAPGVRYFVASMTHPSVTKHLKENNARIIGWHAFSQSGADYAKLPEGDPSSFWVTGGTCSAYRTIGIANTLGFRRFHLFGFDLCYPEDEIDKKAVDDKGRPKYLKMAVGDKNFYTTGELLVAAQDFEQFCKSDMFTNLDINVYGEGVVPEIWKQLHPEDRPTLEELYGEPT